MKLKMRVMVKVMMEGECERMMEGESDGERRRK